MIILRYVLLGLAISIAAVIGLRSAGLSPFAARLPHGAGVPHPARSHQPDVASSPAAVPSAGEKLAQAQGEIVRRLGEVPQFATFYKNLAMGFPHVYADLIDHAAQPVAEGGAAPSSGALLWNALRALQQSNGILAAKADETALGPFFDARLSMLDGLASVDPRTCADFLYGATDSSIEDFSLTHRDLVADMAGKQLAVIEDGQRKHLDPGAPSAEDLDLVAAGLAARKLTPDEIALLLDGKSIDPPLPDARLCEIGRTYLSVLKDLPPPARQRVYGFAAELLARS